MSSVATSHAQTAVGFFQITKALIFFGLCFAVRGETVVSNALTTNHVVIEAGEAALIETSVGVGGGQWGSEMKWEAEGQSRRIRFTHFGSDNPAIFAGPGTLTPVGINLLTFRRMKATNLTTVILASTNALRITVKDGQRIKFLGGFGFDQYALCRLSVTEIGGDFHLGFDLGITVDFHAGKFVLDGPLDVVLHQGSGVLTYTIQDSSRIEAPATLLNYNTEIKSIAIEQSNDAVNWEVNSVILPADNSHKFYRLTTP